MSQKASAEALSNVWEQDEEGIEAKATTDDRQKNLREIREFPGHVWREQLWGPRIR